VIYPFIVNDPGESAQAKRRIGAVTLGHLPPPQAASSMPAGLLRLEQLLDEYSTPMAWTRRAASGWSRRFAPRRRPQALSKTLASPRP